jgi:anti-repressor protein
MNELIKINQGQKEAVSARDLHTFLESKQDFSDWIKNRVEKFEFIEGKDFSIILGESTGGRPSKEYFCTIQMAKELSMVENNEKGKIARKYFIECEKQLKKVFEIPQTYSQALLLAGKLAEENEKQAKQLEDQKPKVEFYDRIIDSNTSINMQEAAGVLNIKGLGRNNLFKMLREKGILNINNIPYREYIEAGYFKVRETVKNIKGFETVIIVTLVNQKGLDFIRKKIEEA